MCFLHIFNLGNLGKNRRCSIICDSIDKVNQQMINY